MKVFKFPKARKIYKNYIKALAINVSSGKRYRMLCTEIGDLSDVEVVESLLQMPTMRIDTRKIAETIVRHYGSFVKFCRLARFSDLVDIEGVNDALAERLLCLLKAIEYCKAFPCKGTAVNMHDFREILKFLDELYQSFDHEFLMLFILGSKGEIIHYERLASGDSDHIVTNFSQIPEKVRYHKGSGIFITHNHPNGNPFPSFQDLVSTQGIIKVCKERNIAFIDHIILARDGHLSFKHSGLLDILMSRIDCGPRELLSGKVFRVGGIR